MSIRAVTKPCTAAGMTLEERRGVTRQSRRGRRHFNEYFLSACSPNAPITSVGRSRPTKLTPARLASVIDGSPTNWKGPRSIQFSLKLLY
jgi:hypothetical protein